MNINWLAKICERKVTIWKQNQLVYERTGIEMSASFYKK